MSRFREILALRLAPLAALFAITLGGKALAVGIDDYQMMRSFDLPTPNALSGGQVLFDSLPNGRLLLLNGATVWVETGLKTGTFNILGDIPGFTPGFGPTFFAVSPDGAHAVAGTGSSVAVFDTSNPASVANHTIQDFSGEWIDNRFLAIVNSGIDILDTVTASKKTVITNIGGASAGVAFDSTGNIYAGNAFDSAPGGSDTGWIKEFSATAWQGVTTTPLDFEATGTPVADLLSAYPVGFDASGNMFVGGGDFYGGSGDFGYAALVDAGAVASALVSPQATPPITPASGTNALRKFASPPDTYAPPFPQPPNWNYNGATGELYLNYAFGDGHVTVYAAVPEPSCLFLVASCGWLFIPRRVPKR